MEASLSEKDANLLRFGIITQLCYAALKEDIPEMQAAAVKELAYLGTRYVAYEGWDSPDVVDAILKALHCAHVQQYNLAEITRMAVDVMHEAQPGSVTVSFATPPFVL